MRRHVGATDYNAQSSRSHTIFRLVIESKTLGDDTAPVLRSELNLIDLAGSERVSTRVGSESGKSVRRTEGSYINKSLLTLGTVIARLADTGSKTKTKTKTAQTHIPYRDSKLTRILQPALCGKAKVAVIATVSPLPHNFEETLSTLKFAQRAKNLRNAASVNELVDDKTLLRRYEREIAELRTKLESQNDVVAESQKVAQLEQDKAILAKAVRENQDYAQKLHDKIANLERLILTSSQAFGPNGGEAPKRRVVVVRRNQPHGENKPPHQGASSSGRPGTVDGQAHDFLRNSLDSINESPAPGQRARAGSSAATHAVFRGGARIMELESRTAEAEERAVHAEQRATHAEALLGEAEIRYQQALEREAALVRRIEQLTSAQQQQQQS
jgi:centromeric protein E